MSGRMLKKKARANRVPSLLDRVLAEAEVSLTAEPENEQIEGNASAINEDTDRETAEWIRDQLASGNEWAWCCVKVTLTWRGLSASDYLGCCSYESRASFVADPYYQDMVASCAKQIAEQAERIRA